MSATGAPPLFGSVAAAGLRTLNLRQNILKDASELNGAEFKSTLVDLELRDNQLREVGAQPAAQPTRYPPLAQVPYRGAQEPAAGTACLSKGVLVTAHPCSQPASHPASLCACWARLWQQPPACPDSVAHNQDQHAPSLTGCPCCRSPRQLPSLSSCPSLTRLELSYNEVRALARRCAWLLFMSVQQCVCVQFACIGTSWALKQARRGSSGM